MVISSSHSSAEEAAARASIPTSLDIAAVDRFLGEQIDAASRSPHEVSNAVADVRNSAWSSTRSTRGRSIPEPYGNAAVYRIRVSPYCSVGRSTATTVRAALLEDPGPTPWRETPTLNWSQSESRLEVAAPRGGGCSGLKSAV